MWLPVLVIILTGYFLGNINGAVFISAMMNDDVRSHGSGNAGLTNFFRSFGKKGTVIVLLIDLIKAILASLVGYLLLHPYGLELEGALLGGFFVTLGHDFPALLGFRGGKGIVCGLAVSLVADWRISLLILIVFLVTFFLTNYVSLGSVLAALTYGIGFCLLHWGNYRIMALGTLISVLALYMHRGNISRLFHGTESKVYLKKKG